MNPLQKDEKRPNGPAKTLVVGLLGGVASGKSAVARLFREAGAVVLDADAWARRELEKPETRAALEARLGPGLVGPGGKVDRKALAELVFRSPRARRILEELIHPPVLARLRARLAELRRRPGTLVVLDVPLLLETGLDALCDHLVFLETSPQERERRARARGWPPGERERREKTQLPLETKRARADYILNNSGSLDETRKQVLDLLESWRA